MPSFATPPPKITLLLFSFLFSCLLLLNFSSAISFASSATDENIKNNFSHYESFYRDLHQNPELSLQEKKTAAKVAKAFKKLGLETLENVGGGVVGIFRNGTGPVTLIRSELDALPIEEGTDLPYKSQNKGVMHACGHDLHTTALLGTASAMIAQKAKWQGTLVFVAQPAEELVKGAQAMIDAGLFKKIPRPDQCVALHTSGKVASGFVAFQSGPLMASADSVDVTIRGQGTHGAAPHRGIDPIVLAADFVLKMQTLIGREVDPLEPALITVGSIHGGTKHNIVPESVKLQLTVRTYNETVRAQILKRIEETAKGLAKTAGAPEPTVAIIESAPTTINEHLLMTRFKSSVEAELGADKLVEGLKTMASEDFGLFAKSINVPSLFIGIGAQNENDKFSFNHSPRFAPDFKVVYPTAVKTMTAGLLELHSLKQLLQPKLTDKPTDKSTGKSKDNTAAKPDEAKRL